MRVKLQSVTVSAHIKRHIRIGVFQIYAIYRKWSVFSSQMECNYKYDELIITTKYLLRIKFKHMICSSHHTALDALLVFSPRLGAYIWPTRN